MILPRIHAVGDVETLTHAMAGFKAQAQPISKMKRRFLLAKLCLAIDLDSHQPKITLPQAMDLANALAELLDELQREQVDISKIENLAPEEYAEHWQSILKFLRVVTQHWPNILAEAGEQDPIAYRNRLLGLLGECWHTHPPAYKIIIAGSTASNSATANLMHIVAGLPDGEVILPALHLAKSQGTYWEALQESHPHFFLKHFLKRVHADVNDVTMLDHSEVEASCHQERMAMIMQMMLPTSHIHQWVQYQPTTEALENIQCITLESVEAETEIIALLCKQALVEKNTAICIVCEEAELRLKLRHALDAHAIIPDASEGMTLAESPWAQFMQLLLNAAEDKHHPLNVLALLKHPLTHLGSTREEILAAARFIELHCYRSQEPSNQLALVRRTMGALPGADAEVALSVLDTYEKFIAPLETCMQMAEIDFASLWTIHQRVAMNCTTGALTDKTSAHSSEAYIENFCDTLNAHGAELGNIDPKDYPATLNLLMAREDYREFPKQHHAIRILPAAEARLETADMVIITGMNEGSWPREVTANPWMSRTMQSALGLHMPEVMASRMAHDLVMLMHTPKVICTRSLKARGVETLESRWLQRLRACCHNAPDASLKQLFTQQPYMDWLAAMYAPKVNETITQPQPRPPVGSRPLNFNITELEQLQRDPYAIYAKCVLQLKPLEPLGDPPTHQLFGNIAHRMLEAWHHQYAATGEPPSAYGEALIQGVLKSYAVTSAQRYLLAPKLLAILHWVVEMHQSRSGQIARGEAEKVLKLSIQGEHAAYHLSGRADRVEYHHDGSAMVVDYKTGTLPVKKDVLQLISCQLPLECLMLMRANETLKPETFQFEYWKLSSGEGKSSVIDFKRIPDMKAFLESTATYVAHLLDSYMVEETAYTAVPDESIKPRYHTYAQLERYAEWV